MSIRTLKSRAIALGLPLAFAALVGLAACGESEGSSGGNGHGGGDAAGGDAAEPADAIAVAVEPAVRQPLSQLYTTSTTLRAEKQATVIARTRGVIERLMAEEGDRVAAGQALAQLENEEQRIAAERARSTHETRQREFERIERLHRQELVSEEAFETARREARDAENAAALTELELSRTVIRAPFSGIVLTRHLDVGATVADGTPVYDLADVAPLYADISVPERHVARLAPGQTVRLIADASGVEVPARIERIAPAVDAATGTVKVTATVEGAAGLRPGAFVRVAIVTDTRNEALVVQRSALVAEGRRWHLYRLTDDGTSVEQLEVELGFEEGSRVEIVGVVRGDEPLAEGDRVVVVGAPALSDGAVVKVLAVEPGADEPPDAGAEPAP